MIRINWSSRRSGEWERALAYLIMFVDATHSMGNVGVHNLESLLRGRERYYLPYHVCGCNTLHGQCRNLESLPKGRGRDYLTYHVCRCNTPEAMSLFTIWNHCQKREGEITYLITFVDATHRRQCRCSPSGIIAKRTLTSNHSTP